MMIPAAITDPYMINSFIYLHQMFSMPRQPAHRDSDCFRRIDADQHGRAVLGLEAVFGPVLAVELAVAKVESHQIAVAVAVAPAW